MSQLPNLTPDQYSRILRKASTRQAVEIATLTAENAELQTRLEDALVRISELEVAAQAPAETRDE